jgi:rod shape-determining protein MreC
MPLYTPGRRRAIILLLLTSVLLLTLDLRGNAVLDAVRTGYNKVLEPFESAADVVTRPIRNAWRGITDYEDKAEEVERLREQLDAQRADQISAQAQIIEHNELLALNNLPALSDYENVVATVVGASPTNIDQVIEIDKGRDDGIDVGMAVVSSAGLVGKITTPLLDDRAYVMLLSDLQYATQVKVVPGAPPRTTTSTTASSTTVPGHVPPGSAPVGTTPTESSSTTSTTSTTTTTTSSTVPTEQPTTTESTTSTSTSTTLDLDSPRETGVLRGQGDGELPEVDLLADTPVIGRIRRGDIVLTAGGTESLAPQNIPVGLVVNVVNRSTAEGPLLEVEPLANLDELNFVRVVLYKPASEVEPAPAGTQAGD